MENFDNEEPEVDNGNLPFVSNDEPEKDESDINSTEETTEETQEEVKDEEKEPELTEKGTKLDPNPQSAIHQQLANERRVRAQYEQVLSDPALLRKYAKEMGLTIEEAKAEIKEEKKSFTPDRFKTAQDVADVLNELSNSSSQTITALKDEIQSLRGELSGFASSRHIEKVASTMQSDISEVQSKYSQLNPKSPDYDPKLEEEIGSFYHELDYDPKTGGYRGEHSLAKITERFMRVRGVGAKEGLDKANTTIKTKVAGKVVTSSKSSSKDVSTSSDPGTSIAQKIAKAMGN